MDVRIREAKDGDWIEIDVDGHAFHEGHSVPDNDWIELLRRAGATVTEEQGDFCSRCGGWFTTPTCEYCEAYDKQQEEEELYG